MCPSSSIPIRHNEHAFVSHPHHILPESQKNLLTVWLPSCLPPMSFLLDIYSYLFGSEVILSWISKCG
ncbi:hypothetical protein ACN38_g11209 [Penicillium nordicum]|uniref:Uncharacterized protein n=1 Tax=Penicillium nordicum TaxID=229535 RepID=A0A0M8NRL1_9EURO|nr:hypothetical protein ACN38_g11209 [Penicillium nordicum]